MKWASLLLLVLLVACTDTPLAPTPEPATQTRQWQDVQVASCTKPYDIFCTATASAAGGVTLTYQGTPAAGTLLPLYQEATRWAAIPTPTPETLYQQTYTVLASGLRVRAGAGTMYPVQGTMGQGDQVDLNCGVEKRADGFAWCEITTGAYKGSWLAAQVLGTGKVYVAPNTE